MRIVVLDGYTLNPGDLSWDALKRLGEVTVYERTSRKELEARALDADVIMTNKSVIDKEFIDRARNLKYIGVMATGYNVVDLKAAKENNIVVTNVPSYSTNSVAQLVFAYMLEFCHGVVEHSEAVKSGKWSDSVDFHFSTRTLRELNGKTLGIIGYGRIGKAVRNIAIAFGMNVIVNTRTPDISEEGVRFVDMDTVFRQSDFLTVHCPLFESTRGLVNIQNLSKMKSSAFLINTSRGPVVVEEDLAEALNNGIIAGAAIDVMTKEPPEKESPLFSAKNIIITPHIAWAPIESRTRLMEVVVENLKAFIDKKKLNVIV
ncbi:MAG: glycerate dehydrogenase [Clostridiales bacterium]|nr:MAG: glycerate dehydrogenase [Clostridiales bacterium]